MRPGVALTQRVAVDTATGERRDAIDQRWYALLDRAEFSPILIPNHAASAEAVWRRARPEALLLTGGNSLSSHGGDAPERDAVERSLVDLARRSGTPVLGVCRGMQLLIDVAGGALVPVENHVRVEHPVRFIGSFFATDSPQHAHWSSLTSTAGDSKNSYHSLGCLGACGALEPVAVADDGVIEAVRHPVEPIWGIMWHPERVDPFSEADLFLLQAIFKEHAQ